MGINLVIYYFSLFESSRQPCKHAAAEGGRQADRAVRLSREVIHRALVLSRRAVGNVASHRAARTPSMGVVLQRRRGLDLSRPIPVTTVARRADATRSAHRSVFVRSR